ncbi:MAG: AAA family ATPase, partial [Bacilli bacterium]|nr:AAA family ATPase [Bacilli bacterium]
IEQFIPEYSNLRINRSERGSAQMLVDKYGQEFDIGQLSDGEKNLIGLIGDIARRLTIGNPNSEDPLKEAGIVLIDEIDLHLHPKWQRIVAERITEVFPNCQFIISSHSPQIISHVRPESVLILQNFENEIQLTRPDESYGMSIDRVVELVMDDYARADEPRKNLDKLFELIERKSLEEAKRLLVSLKKYMKTDPDIMRAEALIRIMERQA